MNNYPANCLHEYNKKYQVKGATSQATLTIVLHADAIFSSEKKAMESLQLAQRLDGGGQEEEARDPGSTLTPFFSSWLQKSERSSGAVIQRK